MSKATSFQERIRIMELNQMGCRDPNIARQLNRSQSTVRKWRRRGINSGQAALVSEIGRPAEGILSTFPESLVKDVRMMRRSHPGWGPKTLRAELKKLHYSAEELPSISSLKRFLKQADLVEPYCHHTMLPEVNCSKPGECHEQWEMDARGHHYTADVGVIALINLNDRHSHARLLCYPCYLGEKRAVRYPQTADYQLALRLAFSEWGMPQCLGVDHDSVFFDNDSPSPFPTRFHLWLIALGVELTFGRKGFPTDQAMTERSHQLWNNQVLKGQTFSDWESLYLALQQRRDFLNRELPCTSLGEQTVIEAHPEIQYPKRIYRAEYEEMIFDIERIHRYLAKGRWIRKSSQNGVVSLGGKTYNLSREWAKQEVEITFHPDSRQLVFTKPKEQERKYLPLKGCSKEELIDELPPKMNLPGFQFTLPLSYEDWRRTKMVVHETGTTL